MHSCSLAILRIYRLGSMNFSCRVAGTEGKHMEATRKGWSEGMNVIGNVLKFGVSVQGVRIPSGQSVDPQVGNKPCDGVGNHDGDA
jgi:hypothetical protein